MNHMPVIYVLEKVELFTGRLKIIHCVKNLKYTAIFRRNVIHQCVKHDF